jgi:hypothetical protein
MKLMSRCVTITFNFMKEVDNLQFSKLDSIQENCIMIYISEKFVFHFYCGTCLCRLSLGSYAMALDTCDSTIVLPTKD